MTPAFVRYFWDLCTTHWILPMWNPAMGFNPMAMGMNPMMGMGMNPGSPGPTPPQTPQKDAEEAERKAKSAANWVSFCEKKGLDTPELRAGFDEWRRSRTEEHMSEYKEYLAEKAQKKDAKAKDKGGGEPEGDQAGELLKRVTALGGKKGKDAAAAADDDGDEVPATIHREIKKHFKVTTKSSTQKDLALELLGKADLAVPKMKKIAKTLRLPNTYQNAKRDTDKSKFVQSAINKLLSEQ